MGDRLFTELILAEELLVKSPDSNKLQVDSHSEPGPTRLRV